MVPLPTTTHQRALEAMEPSDIGRARDVVGVTALGCDAAIEALYDLSDDQFDVQLER